MKVMFIPRWVFIGCGVMVLIGLVLLYVAIELMAGVTHGGFPDWEAFKDRWWLP